MLALHEELAILSCRLQSSNLLFCEVAPLIDATMGKLEYMKHNDGAGLVDMKRSLDVRDENVYYKGEQLKNYSENSKSEFSSVRDKYIQAMIKNIRQRCRKEDSEILANLGLILDPCLVDTSSVEQLQAALSFLTNHNGTEKTTHLVKGSLMNSEECQEIVTKVDPLINGDELHGEWLAVMGMMKGSYAKLDLKNLCKRIILRHHESLPNFSKLACIALCVQVTSVECERSFSTQNRLKNKFRSSLKGEKLDILLNISMSGPALEDYDPKPACRVWLAKKRRRGRLSQDYRPRQTQIQSSAVANKLGSC